MTGILITGRGCGRIFKSKVILSPMSEAIRRTGAQRGGRSRRPLRACSWQGQRIGYFALKKEDKATVLGTRFETCAHCFSGNSCDINGLQAPRGVKMLTEKFEPYGEPLPEFRSGEREQPKATSAILSVVGQYSFWLLVVVIVFTRVAFFSPFRRFPPRRFPTTPCWPG